MMTAYSRNRLKRRLLSPVSGGKFVGWRNVGNTLVSFVRGSQEYGICDAENGEVNDFRNSGSVWDSKPRTVKLGSVWELDCRSGVDYTVQQMITCLCLGIPLYIAYLWWSHALEIVGIRYVPGKYKNIVVILRNSHGETNFIELEGSKCIPYEIFAFGSVEEVGA